MTRTRLFVFEDSAVADYWCEKLNYWFNVKEAQSDEYHFTVLDVELSRKAPLSNNCEP